MFRFLILCLCIFPVYAVDSFDLKSYAKRAGGLALIVDHDQGASAFKLSASKRFLVHLLQTNEKDVMPLRKQAAERGISEFLRIEHWSASVFPYNKNHVNLLVLGNYADVQKRGLKIEEVVRVLSPFGVGCISGLSIAEQKAIEKQLRTLGMLQIRQVKEAQQNWLLFEKPRSPKMGEWTHATHSANGNRVANDSYLEPPNQIQWLGSKISDPRVVSAQGRHFNSTGSEIVCKDVWSGVTLWSTPVDHKKIGRYVTVIGEDVLVKNPGDKAHGNPYVWVLLSGKTGEVLHSFRLAGSPLYENDLLYLSGTMVEVSTRKVLWSLSEHKLYEQIKPIKKKQFRFGEGRGYNWGYKYLLSNGLLYYRSHAGELIVLDARTSEVVQRKDLSKEIASDYIIKQAFGDHVLLYNEVKKEQKISPKAKDKDKAKKHWYGLAQWHAINGRSGQKIWSHEIKDCPLPRRGSVYRVKDTIWFNRWRDPNVDPFVNSIATLATEPAGAIWEGVDIKTGKVVGSFTEPKQIMYHCGMVNASERFLTGNRPQYFTEIGTGEVKGRFGFARPSCDGQSGDFAAQGLYFAMGSVGGCACIRTVSQGSGAFSGDGKTWDGEVENPEHLVVTGPAEFPKNAPAIHDLDWPMFRRDAARSNVSASQVTSNLKLLWKTEPFVQRTAVDESPIATDLERKSFDLSPLIVADSRAYFAIAATKQVVAISTKTGKREWDYHLPALASGPPSYYKGLALVGCHDGWVYALRADNGKLVWRTRVAPAERNIVAYGQVESKWPVVGDVLVVNDSVFALAGRSTEVDGGVYLVQINPTDGSVQKTIRRHLNNPGDIGPADHGRYASIGAGPADLLHYDGKALKIGYHQIGINPKSGEPAKYSLPTYRITQESTAFTAEVSYRAPKLLPSWTNPPKQPIIQKYAKGKKAWKVELGHNKKYHTPTYLIALAGDDVITCIKPYGERKNCELVFFNAETGDRHGALELPALPITEGLAIAHERFYIVTQDARVLCYGK